MLISIITVNYNNCQELERTIQSVLSQSFSDYEYIIIDGGSSDKSPELIQSYDDHLSYWVSEKDGGIYNAMNKGVKVSTGDYCIFLNSGDSFCSNTVLQDISQLISGDIICGNAKVSGSQNYLWTAPDNVGLGFWLNRYSICHQSTIIRTELLRDNPYDESLKIAADYAFFFFETVINKRNYKKIDYTVCNYGADGVSSNHKASEAEKVKVIDRFRYLGLIDEDPLLYKCKRLKTGGKRYRIAKFLIDLLSNEE